jgi:uncharacterized protein YdhG (YjbR/CyaY superfamily)
MNPKVDLWVLGLSLDTQLKVQALRSYILSLNKDIIETWSYGMPAYKIHKVLFYFNVYEHHIGLYPHNEAIEVFSNELKSYKTSKGAIQIPIEEALPLALIGKIIKYNIKKISP